MRVLFTIPHYFAAAAEQSPAGTGAPRYASLTGSRQQRAPVLQACLDHIRQNFSGRSIEFDNRSGLIGGGLNQHRAAWAADIVICTAARRHLLDAINLPSTAVHCEVDTDPRHLGFECHLQMRARVDRYDYFCFLEDDILIPDPMYFSKQLWFHRQFGDDCVLQPNRYELDAQQRKIYVDGPLPEKFVRRYFDPEEQQQIQAECLARPYRFFRSTNPASGCFALNQTQLREWIESPVFDDRDESFGSALESAQILGPMKLYRIYKPAPENAEFLEVVHADPRLTRLQTPRRLLDALDGSE